jgi:hypothetical protein
MNWQHCYPAYGIAMLMLYDAHVEGGGGEIALPFDRNELHCHFLVSFFVVLLFGLPRLSRPRW